MSSYRVSWQSIKQLLSLVIVDLMLFQNDGSPPTGILNFFLNFEYSSENQ